MGITARQILSGTEKPIGLTRKHILHISLERGILWPIVKEEVVIRGIGAQIAADGQQVTTPHRKQNPLMASFAMNVRVNKKTEIAVNLPYHYIQ